MEDALGEITVNIKPKDPKVLILVLMEDALGGLVGRVARLQPSLS